MFHVKHLFMYKITNAAQTTKKSEEQKLYEKAAKKITVF